LVTRLVGLVYGYVGVDTRLVVTLRLRLLVTVYYISLVTFCYGCVWLVVVVTTRFGSVGLRYALFTTFTHTHVGCCFTFALHGSFSGYLRLHTTPLVVTFTVYTPVDYGYVPVCTHTVTHTFTHVFPLRLPRVYHVCTVVTVYVLRLVTVGCLRLRCVTFGWLFVGLVCCCSRTFPLLHTAVTRLHTHTAFWFTLLVVTLGCYGCTQFGLRCLHIYVWLRCRLRFTVGWLRLYGCLVRLVTRFTHTFGLRCVAVGCCCCCTLAFTFATFTVVVTRCYGLRFVTFPLLLRLHFTVGCWLRCCLYTLHTLYTLRLVLLRTVTLRLRLHGCRFTVYGLPLVAVGCGWLLRFTHTHTHGYTHRCFTFGWFRFVYGLRYVTFAVTFALRLVVRLVTVHTFVCGWFTVTVVTFTLRLLVCWFTFTFTIGYVTHTFVTVTLVVTFTVAPFTFTFTVVTLRLVVVLLLRYVLLVALWLVTLLVHVCCYVVFWLFTLRYTLLRLRLRFGLLFYVGLRFGLVYVWLRWLLIVYVWLVRLRLRLRWLHVLLVGLRLVALVTLFTVVDLFPYRTVVGLHSRLRLRLVTLVYVYVWLLLHTLPVVVAHVCRCCSVGCCGWVVTLYGYGYALVWLVGWLRLGCFGCFTRTVWLLVGCYILYYVLRLRWLFTFTRLRLVRLRLRFTFTFTLLRLRLRCVRYTFVTVGLPLRFAVTFRFGWLFTLVTVVVGYVYVTFTLVTFTHIYYGCLHRLRFTVAFTHGCGYIYARLPHVTHTRCCYVYRLRLFTTRYVGLVTRLLHVVTVVAVALFTLVARCLFAFTFTVTVAYVWLVTHFTFTLHVYTRFRWLRFTVGYVWFTFGCGYTLLRYGLRWLRTLLRLFTVTHTFTVGCWLHTVTHVYARYVGWLVCYVGYVTFCYVYVCVWLVTLRLRFGYGCWLLTHVVGLLPRWLVPGCWLVVVTFYCVYTLFYVCTRYVGYVVGWLGWLHTTRFTHTFADYVTFTLVGYVYGLRLRVGCYVWLLLRLVWLRLRWVVTHTFTFTRLRLFGSVVAVVGLLRLVTRLRLRLPFGWVTVGHVCYGCYGWLVTFGWLHLVVTVAFGCGYALVYGWLFTLLHTFGWLVWLRYVTFTFTVVTFVWLHLRYVYVTRLHTVTVTVAVTFWFTVVGWLRWFGYGYVLHTRCTRLRLVTLLRWLHGWLYVYVGLFVWLRSFGLVYGYVVGCCLVTVYGCLVYGYGWLHTFCWLHGCCLPTFPVYVGLVGYGYRFTFTVYGWFGCYVGYVLFGCGYVYVGYVWLRLVCGYGWLRLRLLRLRLLRLRLFTVVLVGWLRCCLRLLLCLRLRCLVTFTRLRYVVTVTFYVYRCLVGCTVAVYVYGYVWLGWFTHFTHTFGCVYGWLRLVVTLLLLLLLRLRWLYTFGLVTFTVVTLFTFTFTFPLRFTFTRLVTVWLHTFVTFTFGLRLVYVVTFGLVGCWLRYIWLVGYGLVGYHTLVVYVYVWLLRCWLFTFGCCCWLRFTLRLVGLRLRLLVAVTLRYVVTLVGCWLRYVLR